MGLPGALDWSPGEAQRLLSGDGVPGYSARLIQSAERYPELVDDPTNVRFVKITKRTRRNSKGHLGELHHYHHRRRRRGHLKDRSEFSST